MLILYFMYRTETEIIYKIIFGRIVKWITFDHVSIGTAIKRYYCENEHYLKKFSMFKSDCPSFMRRKYNGVAAIQKREIHNVCEQHCVGHRKDLAVKDSRSTLY
ncbi:hypothetical protein RF11_16529 [Thelohanellus kitauei]|uniref:Uncharacterized protein n=1 Tax=Thelohanellus kitauei TaxID=669202 RepID=A0A0C2MNA8_THEKT|nr:hypothetical protein RF11_16529 [Thelohanellus kitauei]